MWLIYVVGPTARLTRDEFIIHSSFGRIIDDIEQPIRFGHQMVDGHFVIVVSIRGARNLFFLLFEHLPCKHSLIVVILQLLVQRIYEQLFGVVAKETFKAKHVGQ